MDLNSDCENVDDNVSVRMDDDDGTRMPWSAYNHLYEYVKEKDEKNFLARCKLCLPKQTEISCSLTSSSNLKGHLKVRSFDVEFTGYMS